MWTVVIAVGIVQIKGVGLGAESMHQVDVLTCSMPWAAPGMAAEELAVVILLVRPRAGVQAQPRAIQEGSKAWDGAPLQAKLEGQSVAIHHTHVIIVRTVPEGCLELGVDVGLAAPIAVGAAGLPASPTLPNPTAVPIGVAPHFRPQAEAAQTSVGWKVTRRATVDFDILGVVVVAAMGHPDRLRAPVDDADGGGAKDPNILPVVCLKHLLGRILRRGVGLLVLP
mmetsp:Transcript_16032/g.30222  ORF Transcript_16032/g.30222 Transcript_16032/m.30222 type:complete len:225 (+) Transcript_16032:101-775(+)